MARVRKRIRKNVLRNNKSPVKPCRTRPWESKMARAAGRVWNGKITRKQADKLKDGFVRRVVKGVCCEGASLEKIAKREARRGTIVCGRRPGVPEVRQAFNRGLDELKGMEQ